MTKPELIDLIKLEYGKAEDYFGLASSCGFEVVKEELGMIELTRKWPLYTIDVITTELDPDNLQSEQSIRLAVWSDVLDTWHYHILPQHADMAARLNAQGEVWT